MAEEADWSLATWEGSRRRQHQEFHALSFREKVQVLEELDEVVRAFTKDRTAANAAGDDLDRGEAAGQ